MKGWIKHIWKTLAQPKATVPVLLAAALLAVAVSLSNIPLVFQRIGKTPLPYLLWTLAFAAAYLISKGLQLQGFLKDLDVVVPWRSVLLAYTVGELTLTLPLGIYAQNYLLQRMQGSRLSRTVAATTLMLVFEAGMFFLLLALLGVAGWPWLRPVALFCLAGLIAFVGLLTRWKRLQRRTVRVVSALRLPGTAVQEFLDSLGVLANRRILLRRGYLTALYVVMLIGAFHTVAHGVGVPKLDFLQAATIYAFSLSIALIFGGITSQVGVVEIAGMGVARLYGYSFTEGLAMLLGFRLIWTACIWLLCLPIVFWLRDRLTASGGHRRQKPPH